MNKKTILTSTVATLVVLGTATTAFAYKGDPTVEGPNFDADRHEAMETAFETTDYSAWKELMADRGPARVVTEENFARFTEAHELAEAGDLDGAKQIREELGLGLGSQNRGKQEGQMRQASGDCDGEGSQGERKGQGRRI